MKCNKFKENKNKIQSNVWAKYTSKSNGITLIALIVTIIVLLILASIVINLIIGQNGIIAKAKWSEYVTEYETIKEREELYKTDYTLEKIGQENGASEINDILTQTKQDKIAMYPVNNKVDINNVSTTLKETIEQIENLNSTQITDESYVNLYMVDLEKINVTAKKTFEWSRTRRSN